MGEMVTARNKIAVARESGVLDLSGLGLNTRELRELIPLIRNDIPALSQLNISDNRLEDLPSEIGSLTALISLDVSGNKLDDLPAAIGNLRNLIYLDASRNKLIELPSEAGNLTHLSELNVSDNHLIDLPSVIGELTNLTHLDCRNNQLDTVPMELLDLSQLRKLSLEGNPLHTITTDILTENFRPGVVSYDRTAHASIKENVLEAWGRIAVAWKSGRGALNLSGLNLDTEELSELIPQIELIWVSELDISCNGLARGLPPGISRLQGLTGLDVSDCHLTHLSPEIGRLINLRELYCCNNQLDTLPPAIDNLPLHRLFLDNNPLSDATVRWADARNQQPGAQRITYDREAFAHMHVLKQLYKPEEVAAVTTRIESCDLDLVPMVTLYNGKDVEVEISAKEAIKKFLIGVPVADGPQRAMYGEPAKAVLEGVLGANGASREARQHELAQMAPCLGNCGTPIESYIRQLYLGKRIMAGTLSEKDEKLLEREAVQEAALRLAHFRFDETEGIEVMRGLLNAVYMDNAENNPSNTMLPISGERSRLPALLTDHINFPFEALVGKKELINEYVDMTCRTDKEGRPVLDADGKYQLNGKKLMLIADGYKLARALPCSPLGQGVLQYGQEMRSFLQDPDVAHLSIEHMDVPSNKSQGAVLPQ